MEGNKLTKTQNAIKALVDVFNAEDKKDSVDVRYKLVTFATSASVETNQWVYGDELYNDYVEKLSAYGGTNYDQGLTKGADAVGDARTEAKKVVIFLTDGKPTYYGTRPDGCGEDTSTNVMTYAINSAAKIICSDFYAVGIGLPDKVNVYKYDNCRYHLNYDSYLDSDYKNLTGQGVLDKIKDSVNAANKEAWNLTDASTLTSKFQEIAGETLRAACTDVVITDQLSDYVDVTKNSKLKVKVAVREANGTYNDKYSHDFTLAEGGDVIVDGKTIATVRYADSTKTATLDFVNSYELEDNYYYYLSITNVIPNETAFKVYKDNNYSYGTTVGDDKTDEGGDGYYATNNSNDATTKTITSSGQPGFASNATATISYKSKASSDAKPENYANPVVQVQTIPVRKVWSEDPAGGTEILVQLVDKEGKAVKGKILKLSEANDWHDSLVVEKAAKYDNYSYRELKADENGTIIYHNVKYSMVDEGSNVTINQISYKVTYSNTDGTRVITNTKNSQSMKIVKQSNLGTTLEGAEFTLTDGNSNKISCQATGKDGIVFNDNINYGTYTLKEIKAPNGYALLNADITITVAQNGITVPNNDKVSISKGDDGTYTIIVKNDMLYSLPSTGGSGIYWFSICGMLLMMAAAWIIYKNKCREVLVK